MVFWQATVVLISQNIKKRYNTYLFSTAAWHRQRVTWFQLSSKYCHWHYPCQSLCPCRYCCYVSIASMHHHHKTDPSYWNSSQLPLQPAVHGIDLLVCYCKNETKTCLYNSPCTWSWSSLSACRWSARIWVRPADVVHGPAWWRTVMVTFCKVVQSACCLPMVVRDNS